LLAHRAGVDVDLAATRRRFHALALGSVGGSTVSPSGGSSRGRTSSFEEGSQP
jgi:hypothetical protein